MARPDDSNRANAAIEAQSSQKPLHGIRVIDLSMGWAGPLAARHLAIWARKSSRSSRASASIGGAAGRPPKSDRDECGGAFRAFNTVNRNKLDVTLDLISPDGKELLKRLVAIADVVVENYSAGVLPKLGLGYDALKAVNSRIGDVVDARIWIEWTVGRLSCVRFDRRACIGLAAPER